jgi:2-polyprenyl-6-methoxyphenol hydroxylase-like FAD-dependent oxidoreductase
MKRHTVLISGAGVAGSTLAYWLARHGFAVTVVERSQRQRSSGNPVDVRGEALAVTERMGVRPALREAATSVTGIALVTASGRWIGRLANGGRDGDVEVSRADLAAILYGAARSDAEFLFGDSVVALRQDPAGVDVTLADGGQRRFDLVVGADGLHSAVRGLAFGPESDYVRHLGMYVATVPLGYPAADPATVFMYNMPGRSVSVHPVTGSATVAFIFRSPAIDGLDTRDAEACKRVVLDAYRGGGWELPGLLDRLSAADDLYFDSVSAVRLPEWSRGRVALAGDAASCLSLLGNGSSLAIAAGANLARALGDYPDDHAAAFRAYETEHRARVRPAMRGRFIGGALLVPATRAGMVARDLAVRAVAQRGTRGRDARASDEPFALA